MLKQKKRNIRDSLQERILILDGAMGTLLQSMNLAPDVFHRGIFRNWEVPLSRNFDILNIAAPDIVESVHQRYVEAGADIIETNTFSSSRQVQAKYQCENLSREIALNGARIARRVADSCTDRHVWVAGVMGPTGKSLSLASDMSRPAWREVDFDTLAADYKEQAEALIEGGADLLLLETCFDALNAKAALYAISELNEQWGTEIPVMVSATVSDRSQRTLTGQTLEAFYISIAHYPILSFGLNCSFGVKDMRPFIERVASFASTYISVHPNAGLPNEMGEYEELPDYTAYHLQKMAEDGLLNIAGGCCGTDDRHIRAIAEALKGIAPRKIGDDKANRKSLNHGAATGVYGEPLMVSGLEPYHIGGTDREDGKAASLFTNIGERTNVAGSRKFARLINEKHYDEAATVARQQIDGGASVIDINMDDAMLDSRQEMQTFVRYIQSDPGISRAALMIDSSDWPTLIEGLKNAQGKCIVNSISLKEGEEAFLQKAKELHRLGAAVVVMAFDEEGQAVTYERKIQIAERAYRLLTGIGFPPQDIVIDMNILSVGTGMAEHAAYAIDFIKAVEWVKKHLPGAKTSGGVSNLSFAFRGNNAVREAMHSVFLFHAVRAGLDMAIVNPTMLQVYDDIQPELLRAVEDVILNTDAEATERLIVIANALKENAAKATDSSSAAKATASTSPLAWREGAIEERLTHSLSKGISEYLAIDIPEALQSYHNRAVDVIEQPLMNAMEHVGKLFGEGKMFLPQVVKSAQVMKEAVALLQPYMPGNESAPDSEPTRQRKPVAVLATANGDVHDIGKNIVSIVLTCNGFDVHDLGVMVSNQTILETTQRLQPCFVGVSGLITPSLKEMENLCRLFQQYSIGIPIIVGGATTSPVHTAVRLAPLYDGGVIYGGDASQTAVLAKHLQTHAEETIRQAKEEQQQIRTAYQKHAPDIADYDEANRQAKELPFGGDYPSIGELRALEEIIAPSSAQSGTSIQPSLPIEDIISHISWRMFLHFWGFRGESLTQQLTNPEAAKTLEEGQLRLRDALKHHEFRLALALHFEEAVRHGNDIVLADGTVLPMLRSQNRNSGFPSLADYFSDTHPLPIGLFTIVAEPLAHDDHHHADCACQQSSPIMDHALCARLVEACAEWLQQRVYDDRPAIRPAFGYAACPDHSLKRIVFDKLNAEERLGASLTDHYSIRPSTAICGLLIGHPEARYFPLGAIDGQQLADYSRRRGLSEEEIRQQLSKNFDDRQPSSVAS
ncbi:MAG: methionine synthase [Prevotella sp.]|nr:methionine synthase [Prevotella sp.]